MQARVIRLAGLVFAAVLACMLAGCGGSQAQSASGSASVASSAGSGASAASGESGSSVRAEIEDVMAQVRATAYKNLTFKMHTETSVTGTNDEGRAVKQTVTTTMDGEFAKNKKKPKMHLNYENRSNTRPSKTVYEVFADSDGVLIVQDGQVYTTDPKETKTKDYTSLVTDLVSKKEIASLLDVAKDCKIEHSGEGDDVVTTITITADAAKLAESDFVDTASLPEHASIASMVANYVIDSDNHLKTVRFLSSTSGTPTYRVKQTYSLSKYDKTKLPDWPSAEGQATQDSRIKTDDEGNKYIMQDGVKYIIDSIDEDGTIHAHAEGGDGATGGGDPYVTYGGGNGGGGGGGNGGGGGGNGGGNGGGGDGGGNIAAPSVSEGNGGSTDMGAPVLTEGGK